MGLTEQIFEVLLLLRPWDIDIIKVRVGHEKDGGYILANKFDISDTVVSIGISKESSFDRDMAKLGKRVLQYDHTIDAPPERYETARWHKLGLSTKDDILNNMTSMASIVAGSGLSENQAILKMDIEGAEWDVLADITPETLATFSQITIELHRLEKLYDESHREKIKASLSKLNEQFTLFHVHANNASKMTRVDSFFTPECLEVSYIKTDLVSRSPSRTLYPTEIDRPNNPSHPEYYLWMFPYMPTDFPDTILRRSLRQTESFWGQ